MKNRTAFFTMVIASMLLFSSCLNDNDDEDSTVYSDMAITQLTLGTLNRYTHTTSSKTGNDTIVKTTLTGSNYRMTIDQIGHRIWNQDSLPVGTDTKHVIVTISTKNGGVALLKSLTSDTLSYISNKDSVDFSQPRTLRVYAADGSAFRDYTVTLGVSQTTGVNFGWKLMEKRADLTGWGAEKHLVAFGDTVALVNRGTIAVNNICFGGWSLVRLNDNGYIEFTHSVETDAEWRELADEHKPEVSQLLYATEHELFGIGADGRLKASTDGFGFFWRDEPLDDDVTLLPSGGIGVTSWPYAPSDSTDYILMAGCYRDDAVQTLGNGACSYASLWRKLSQYHRQGDSTEGQWVYMPFDDNNREPLPLLEWYSLACYDGAVLCLGSDLAMRRSRDQGITWQVTTDYALPASLDGDVAAMASDASGRLWVVTSSGQVWRGSKL